VILVNLANANTSLYTVQLFNPKGSGRQVTVRNITPIPPPSLTPSPASIVQVTSTILFENATITTISLNPGQAVTLISDIATSSTPSGTWWIVNEYTARSNLLFVYTTTPQPITPAFTTVTLNMVGANV